MELNKRRSLLTPAAPTVWGMIHGDINNQQDIVEKIDAVVKSEIENLNISGGVDLTGYATESWVNDEIQNKIVEIEGVVNNEVLEVKGYVDSEVLNLKTYMDEQIGAIDTMTQDILG